MATPVITTPSPVFEQISTGISYARTIAASNTPTSFAASGLPAGLSIDNSGAITGAPTATTATSYSVSITATNGDGTSTALTWLIVVLPFVVGLAADGFKIPVNLDLYTRRLSLPGIGGGQPAGNPPGGSGGESAPLGTWIEGERFALSLGIEAAAVLQELALNRIRVLWRESLLEPAINLHEDSTAITETGSGTTARYEVPVFVDPDLVRGILSGKQRADRERASGYLQIIAEASTDASDYSSTETQTITALSASDTEAKTFAVTLVSTSAAALRYRVTLDLTVPGDTSLSCRVVREITVSYNSGGSTYVVATNTGDASDSGTPTNPSYYSTTLTPTSITATGTGISVVGTATTTAFVHSGKAFDLLATEGANSDLFTVTAGVVGGVSGSITLDMLASSVSIGDITIADGATAASIKSAIETAISETLVAVLFPDSTTIRIIFDASTAVEDHHWGGEVNLGAPDSFPTPSSYTDASITCLVEGVAMPEQSETISSQVVRHDIEASFAES
jgi:hypothetical protein